MSRPASQYVEYSHIQLLSDIPVLHPSSRHSRRLSRRPASIWELSDRAVHALWEWEEGRNLKHYLRLAQRHKIVGKVYLDDGELENAFVEFAKAAILIFEKLPAHSDYYRLNLIQRCNIGKHGRFAMDELFSLKTELVNRYNQWEERLRVLVYEGPLSTKGFDKADGYHSVLARLYLRSWFKDLLADRSRYRTLLTFRGEGAQKVLDIIQMLLDDPELNDSHLRQDLLFALLRLSKVSGLFPRCYILKDIQRGNDPITSGHFGEIWKGEIQGRKVCLKMVKVYERSQVDHLLKAFCKEAIIWRHLRHRNLLPFHGIHVLEDLYGRFCLVSPWMENGNVVEYLRRKPDADRPLLISDILQGISYLHDRNVVHGDLKGVNVLITSSEIACLADFGLCSVVDADIVRWTSITSVGHNAGTVRWQAPELFNPDEDESPMPTKASDIYAFACTCYEIFTGRVPFSEVPRDANVMYKVMRGERPSNPSSIGRKFPYYEHGLTPTMWTLMEHCWHSDPSSRPTARQLVTRLPMTTSTANYRKQDSNALSPSHFCIGAMCNASDRVSVDDIEFILSLCCNGSAQLSLARLMCGFGIS